MYITPGNFVNAISMACLFWYSVAVHAGITMEPQGGLTFDVWANAQSFPPLFKPLTVTSTTATSIYLVDGANKIAKFGLCDLPASNTCEPPIDMTTCVPEKKIPANSPTTICVKYQPETPDEESGVAIRNRLDTSWYPLIVNPINLRINPSSLELIPGLSDPTAFTLKAGENDEKSLSGVNLTVSDCTPTAADCHLLIRVKDTGEFGNRIDNIEVKANAPKDIEVKLKDGDFGQPNSYTAEVEITIDNHPDLVITPVNLSGRAAKVSIDPPKWEATGGSRDKPPEQTFKIKNDEDQDISGIQAEIDVLGCDNCPFWIVTTNPDGSPGTSRNMNLDSLPSGGSGVLTVRFDPEDNQCTASSDPCRAALLLKINGTTLAKVGLSGYLIGQLPSADEQWQSNCIGISCILRITNPLDLVSNPAAWLIFMIIGVGWYFRAPIFSFVGYLFQGIANLFRGLR